MHISQDKKVTIYKQISNSQTNALNATVHFFDCTINLTNLTATCN